MLKNEVLTLKQKAFCNEYLIDLNATQAAIRAGYSKKTAYSIGGELLKKPEIKKFIEERTNECQKRTEITADFVLSGIKEVAQRCLQKTPVKEWNYEEKRLEMKVDEEGRTVWEFDSAGANKAFEMLAKHLNLFKEAEKEGVKVVVEIKQVP